MIDPNHKLPISRQVELLQINRSSIYYRPRPISDADLMLMRRIDELHMNYPFAGSRTFRKPCLPVRDLVGVNIELLCQFGQGLVPFQCGQGHFRFEACCVIPAWTSCHRCSSFLPS